MISEMSDTSLIDRTRALFPEAHGEIEMEPLLKGGSDRVYYRVVMPIGPTVILVKYGSQFQENKHYVRIAQFLHAIDVRVPNIFHHDEAEGLIWMEDLGDDDLYSHRDEDWDVRRELYSRTLDQILILHGKDLSLVPDDLHLENEFTQEMYLWEQGYFLEHCLGTHFKLPVELRDKLRASAPLVEAARRLARRPRTLVHRDFQSQNVLFFEGDAHLIDFQGLRPGLPHYDLASLLYDPYVSLAETERRYLFDYYVSAAIDAGHRVTNEFELNYSFAALQRLMQALGAYGFLGHIRKREDFLAHIPVALASLREVVEKLGTMPELLRVLNDLEA